MPEYMPAPHRRDGNIATGGDRGADSEEEELRLRDGRGKPISPAYKRCGFCGGSGLTMKDGHEIYCNVCRYDRNW